MRWSRRASSDLYSDISDVFEAVFEGVFLDDAAYAELATSLMHEARTVQLWVEGSANPPWLAAVSRSPLNSEAMDRMLRHWDETQNNFEITAPLVTLVRKLKTIAPANTALRKLQPELISVGMMTFRFAAFQRSIAATLFEQNTDPADESFDFQLLAFRFVQKQQEAWKEVEWHYAEIGRIGRKLARSNPGLARQLEMIS